MENNAHQKERITQNKKVMKMLENYGIKIKSDELWINGFHITQESSNLFKITGRIPAESAKVFIKTVKNGTILDPNSKIQLVNRLQYPDTIKALYFNNPSALRTFCAYILNNGLFGNT